MVLKFEAMALSKGDDGCLDVVASTLKKELQLDISLCFKDRLKKGIFYCFTGNFLAFGTWSKTNFLLMYLC